MSIFHNDDEKKRQNLNMDECVNGKEKQNSNDDEAIKIKNNNCLVGLSMKYVKRLFL